MPQLVDVMVKLNQEHEAWTILKLIKRGLGELPPEWSRPHTDRPDKKEIPKVPFPPV